MDDSTLRLVCFVIDISGKSINKGHSFGVTIARTALVGELVQEIMSVMGEIHPGPPLHFWKPKFNLPDDTPARLARSIYALHLDPRNDGRNDHATLLLTSSLLENHFPAPLPECCIHVIAQQPPPFFVCGNVATGESSIIIGHEGRCTAIDDGRMAAAPSNIARFPIAYKEEQKGHPIYNGRPDYLTGPSVGLYSKTFAQLIDTLGDLSGVVPTPHEIASTGKFMQEVSDIYPMDIRLRDVVFERLNTLLGVPIHFRIKTGDKGVVGDCDGISFASLGIGEQAILAYYQVKSELGSTGDTSLQAALTYRKHIAHRSYDDIRCVSCCPCFIIAVTGPYICFLSAVFSHVPIVQHLTDYIYLGGHPFTRDRVPRIARIFHVVSKAIQTLLREYSEIRAQAQSEIKVESPSCTFPYSTFGVTDQEGRPLNYHERLEDGHNPGRAIWRGKLGNTEVIVKFCEAYGAEPHRLLADTGLAPRLHHFGRIEGGLHIVVMDFVQGTDAHNYFQQVVPPQMSVYVHVELSDGVREDVTAAIKILHDAGFVFGDLRRPNIIVIEGESGTDGNRETRGMLVDFDWAGIYGQATYPPVLNDTGDIERACGVGAGGLIEKEHDLFMLRNL